MDMEAPDPDESSRRVLHAFDRREELRRSLTDKSRQLRSELAAMAATILGGQA